MPTCYHNSSATQRPSARSRVSWREYLLLQCKEVEDKAPAKFYFELFAPSYLNPFLPSSMSSVCIVTGWSTSVCLSECKWLSSYFSRANVESHINTSFHIPSSLWFGLAYLYALVISWCPQQELTLLWLVDQRTSAHMGSFFTSISRFDDDLSMLFLGLQTNDSFNLRFLGYFFM